MQMTLKINNCNGIICVYITEADVTPVGTLVCVHGGPGGDHRGNDGIFDDIGKYCGRLGYNLVQFDMFGAGESEGTPRDITLKSQFQDYISVLKFVGKHFRVPVHVVGESMGATIAALDWQPGITTYILLWPAFDLRDTDLQPYLSDKWKTFLHDRGYIEDNGIILGRDFMEEVASYDFSHCFRLPESPCLLIHGKRDSAVPFRQSVEAVLQASGECVLFAHTAGDHGLQRPDEREFTRRAIKWWLSR
jgi:pimeloyl-ACP methyl ester carboxylesterase